MPLFKILSLLIVPFFLPPCDETLNFSLPFYGADADDSVNLLEMVKGRIGDFLLGVDDIVGVFVPVVVDQVGNVDVRAGKNRGNLPHHVGDIAV